VRLFNVEFYHSGEVAYYNRGHNDTANMDYSQPLTIKPKYAVGCRNRGRTYCFIGEYDKPWEDVHRVQSLGYKVPDKFFDALRKASGREE
jgi:hypothetical protein